MNKRRVDGGYAWLVLVAAFLTQAIVAFIAFSPGITNIAVMEEIENDITKTSWIGSTLFGMYTLLGPVAGVVQTSIGTRNTAVLGGVLSLAGLSAAALCHSVTTLILTSGCVTGTGLCLGGNLAGVVPGRVFVKRRALAYGITMAGGAAGLFIAGPLTDYLLRVYGIHGTFLLLGAISFHTCIAGFIFHTPVEARSITVKRNSSSSVSMTPETGTLYSNDIKEIESDFKDEEVRAPLNDGMSNDKSVLKLLPTTKMAPDSTVNKRCISAKAISIKCFRSVVPNQTSFILFNFSIILWGLGQSACIFHLPNFAVVKGSSKSEGASLFTTLGAAGLFSRVCTGLIASDARIGYLTVHMGLLGVAGILASLFPLYSHTYTLQLVYSLAYGLYSEGVNSLMAPVTIDLIGLQSVAVGFGFVYMSCGVGFFLGPPVASTYQCTVFINTLSKLSLTY